VHSDGNDRTERLVAEVVQTKLPEPSERLALRMAAGLSLRRMARILDVSAPTLQAWESGTQPRPGNARMYRALLDDIREVLADASHP
jgi:DNA-binding transcriptional regulator YiaG